MKKDKKTIRIANFALVFGIMLGLILGIILGMFMQQAIVIGGAYKVAQGLEGTNFEINIDLNETELVNGFSQVLNETIKEGFKEEEK